MKGIYGFARMGMLVDECEQEDMTVLGQFKSGQDLQEGISGRKRIDSTYENYCNEDDRVQKPRSTHGL